MSLNTRTTNQSFPTNITSLAKKCPICDQAGNRLAIYEAGIEHRFGVPVVPTSDYGQLLCKRCGFLYLNTELSSDYLTSLYAQENLRWQEEYLSESTAVWNGGTQQDEIDRFTAVASVIRSFRSDPKMNWLDFGCQTGELGEVCSKLYGAVMFGVEVSTDYGQTAEKKWGRPGSVRQSINSFKEDGVKFDIISSLETLEHLAFPWKAVADFKQVLKPHGLVLITVPSTHYFYLKYLIFKSLRRLFTPSAVRDRAQNTGRSIFGLCHTHPYNFSPKSMKIMLESNGFEVAFSGGTGWARKFRWAEFLASGVAKLTGGSIQIYPSLLVVAKPKI